MSWVKGKKDVAGLERGRHMLDIDEDRYTQNKKEDMQILETQLGR